MIGIGLSWLALSGIAVIISGLGYSCHRYIRTRRKLSASRAETAMASRAVDLTEQILARSCNGYFSWRGAAGWSDCPPGVIAATRLLGGANSTYDDFCALLSRLDKMALLEKAGALVQDGRPFELRVKTSDGTAFDIRGHRINLKTQLLSPDQPSLTPATADDSVNVMLLDDVTRQVVNDANQQGMLNSVEAERDALYELFNAAPFPIWRRDGDLALTMVNTAYCSSVEADTAEVLATGIELATGTLSKTPKSSAAAAQDSSETQHEPRHVVVEGQRRAFDIYDVPLSVDGVAGFAADITALEETQIELSRHIESHADTLDKLTTAIAIFGSDMRLTFYNNAFAALWHVSSDWLNMHPLHSEVLDAMRDRRRLPEQADFKSWKAQILKQYTDLLEAREELWPLPDDTMLRVVTQPHPMGGLLFFFEDVTDRLAIERSYNTLSAVQQESLNNLYEGVSVYNGDGRLNLWNPAMAKIWQWDETLLNNRPHITEVLEQARELLSNGSESDWEEVKTMFVQRTLHRDTSEERFERTDGRIIDTAFIPLPDGATLITCWDITDNVKVELALRERNEALETADNLKAVFISNVSYELRTPLNSIMGFANMLDGEYFGPLNERQKEHLKSILSASNQLLSLIDEILDLTNIEAGNKDLDQQSFSFPKMLNNAVELVRPAASTRDITLNIECDPDVDSVVADRQRLIQVVVNLLSNAVRATPAKGILSVCAKVIDDHISFWIRNDGEEATPATSHSLSSDLGLSLAQRYLELHGGWVDRPNGTKAVETEGTLDPNLKAVGNASYALPLSPGAAALSQNVGIQAIPQQ